MPSFLVQWLTPWRQYSPWCKNSIGHQWVLHEILCRTSLLGFSQSKLCNLLIRCGSAGINYNSVKILYHLILLLFNIIPYDVDWICLQRCLEWNRDGWILIPKKKWRGLYSSRRVLISVQLLSTSSLEGRCLSISIAACLPWPVLGSWCLQRAIRKGWEFCCLDMWQLFPAPVVSEENNFFS